METKTFTAPLAIIKIGGQVVGKIRGLNIQENYQRGNVIGLGSLVASEKPILAINCSFSCSSYVLSVKKLGSIENPFVKKGAKTPEQLINTLLTQDVGVDIYVLKKGAKNLNEGIVTETSEEVMFVIRDAFLTSQQFDIQEGQISGSNMSGEYLIPVLGNLD